MKKIIDPRCSKQEQDAESPVLALITAAGSSSRMGDSGNKLFMDLCGKTVIRRCMEIFENSTLISAFLLTAAPADLLRMREEAKGLTKCLAVVSGGEVRSESVLFGLRALRKLSKAGGDALVLVHDGARPLLSEDKLRELIETNRRAHCAVGLAVEVSDTMRVLRSDGKIDYSPERSLVRAMQTPQAAELELFLRALELAREEHVQLSDDLEALARIGCPMQLVRGERSNIKITWPEDILVAKVLLENKDKHKP